MKIMSLYQCIYLIQHYSSFYTFLIPFSDCEKPVFYLIFFLHSPWKQHSLISPTWVLSSFWGLWLSVLGEPLLHVDSPPTQALTSQALLSPCVDMPFPAAPLLTGLYWALTHCSGSLNVWMASSLFSNSRLPMAGPHHKCAHTPYSAWVKTPYIGQLPHIDPPHSAWALTPCARPSQEQRSPLGSTLCPMWSIPLSLFRVWYLVLGNHPAYPHPLAPSHDIPQSAPTPAQIPILVGYT